MFKGFIKMKLKIGMKVKVMRITGGVAVDSMEKAKNTIGKIFEIEDINCYGITTVTLDCDVEKFFEVWYPHELEPVVTSLKSLLED